MELNENRTERLPEFDPKDSIYSKQYRDHPPNRRSGLSGLMRGMFGNGLPNINPPQPRERIERELPPGFSKAEWKARKKKIKQVKQSKRRNRSK